MSGFLSHARRGCLSMADNATQTRWHLLFVFFTFAIFIYSMQVRWGGAIADDGAFFLRYAENMQSLQFWVWNLGEEPIWGASAPLYALFLALLMALGISPMAAIVGGGAVLGASALSLVTWVLVRQFGYFTGLIFIAFACLDGHLMWFSGTAGLETPLSIGILAYGFWALVDRRSSIHVGVAAGLLAVNKIDLIPAAFFLIVAWGMITRSLPLKTIVIAALIAATWYVFAWAYFGLPVPNSVVTKALFQNKQKFITWMWFGNLLLVESNRYWFACLALAAVVLINKKTAPIVIFFGGLMATHLLVYTVKFPVEEYGWYAMPSLFSVIVLASIGATVLWESLVVFRFWLLCRVIMVGLIGLLVTQNALRGIETTQGIKHYLNLEKDRSNAGRWVMTNTPENFRLLTSWGGPAYFSHRESLDWSFLNRRYEDVDMVAVYRPEVVIASDKKVSNEYTLVKIFNKAAKVGIDYPFGVHIRNDVLAQVTDVDRSLEACSVNNNCVNTVLPLFDYIINQKLGDKYGVIQKYYQNDTIFVHPGFSQSTSFDIDVAKLEGRFKVPLRVTVMISDKVSDEAVQRGAAIVGVTVTLSGVVVVERSIVKFGSPVKFDLPYIESGNYHFEIDNNGDADTDWTLVSLSLKDE
jgi:hypothetical protein